MRKLEKIQVEFRFRKKDGNYIDIEIRGVWLKDDEGKVYRAIGVLKDITEWKFAIEKSKQVRRSIALLYRISRGLFFKLDENFIPVFLQGAVEEITGYSEEEFGFRVSGKT